MHGNIVVQPGSTAFGQQHGGVSSSAGFSGRMPVLLTVAVSVDGTMVATGGISEAVGVWDARSADHIADFPGQRHAARVSEGHQPALSALGGSHDQDLEPGRHGLREPPLRARRRDMRTGSVASSTPRRYRRVVPVCSPSGRWKVACPFIWTSAANAADVVACMPTHEPKPSRPRRLTDLAFTPRRPHSKRASPNKPNRITTCTTNDARPIPPSTD